MRATRGNPSPGNSISEVDGRGNSDSKKIAPAKSSDVFEQNRVDDRTNPSDKLLCHIVDVRDD